MNLILVLIFTVSLHLARFTWYRALFLYIVLIPSKTIRIHQNKKIFTILFRKYYSLFRAQWTVTIRTNAILSTDVLFFFSIRKSFNSVREKKYVYYVQNVLFARNNLSELRLWFVATRNQNEIIGDIALNDCLLYRTRIRKKTLYVWNTKVVYHLDCVGRKTKKKNPQTVWK